MKAQAKASRGPPLSPSSISLGSHAARAPSLWLCCSLVPKSWHFLLIYFWIVTLPELWHCIPGINLPLSGISLLILSIMSDLALTQFSMTVLPLFNCHPFYLVTCNHPDYCSICQNAPPCSTSKNHVPIALFTICVFNSD